MSVLMHLYEFLGLEGWMEHPPLLAYMALFVLLRSLRKGRAFSIRIDLRLP